MTEFAKTIEARVSETTDLTVCGEVYSVRRSPELTRNMERLAGPLRPLSMRLRRAEISQSDLAILIETAVQPGGPSRADVMAWLYEAGTHKPAAEMAILCASLVIGRAGLLATASEG